MYGGHNGKLNLQSNQQVDKRKPRGASDGVCVSGGRARCWPFGWCRDVGGARWAWERVARVHTPVCLERSARGRCGALVRRAERIREAQDVADELVE